MARVAGVAYVKVDGGQIAVRGNLTIGPTTIIRKGIAGQDGFHGHSEIPAVPYIECDVTTIEGHSMDVLQNMTNVTVTAELANGKTYVLSEAFTVDEGNINTSEGSTKVRWEGAYIDEF